MKLLLSLYSEKTIVIFWKKKIKTLIDYTNMYQSFGVKNEYGKTLKENGSVQAKNSHPD